MRQATPGAFTPILAALLGLVSVQSGAAVGKAIFPLVGPEGVAALRLGLSALILLAVLRPWRIWRQANLRDLVGYGLMMGLMNLLIYRAFLYIPVGIAVSIEVIGPLGVALLSSRRRIDLLWIALSVFGLVLLPWGAGADGLDLRGVAYALAAALAWGLYVTLGTRVAVHGRQAVASGMLVAALLGVPLGTLQAGSQLLQPTVLAVGLAVALLSSTLPFLLDMFAMRHLPPSVFGVLLSASPAAGAIAGWLVLGETLSLLQCVGIAAIAAACAGAALVGRAR
ncbi:EamA family transporter [Pseudomonas sichuanensis]|uniref:EamA family transporter n=1 Tax=Pseudomonas sichuanensis TaxID=2213015 RepID=UPI00244D5F7D|nr:EamA family transporter [Pseudomonas sichuanensis]MDH0731814.1 EamA family transporter [Pseudomonas sichuanensis]MDH1583920.1 EamA family transporter [Pseudomonas sichuanensis]MDH1592406.1 EamA family transporter [Pseudomonas sichuanensis]MDH1598157.1 EamA family transporter [Pseudomonas sichuanensis]